MHSRPVLIGLGVAIYCLVKSEFIGIRCGSLSAVCRYEFGVNRSCRMEAGIQ
ncbi:hypothetical protein Bra471DRAFT_01490 [Bradyrhizobium sp. WSM471]|nr:hypothetical protein Bra471DRAFT_01490 [Bradyrhizobium sp. WSM471]